MPHSTGVRSRPLTFTTPAMNAGQDVGSVPARGRSALPPDGAVVFGLRPSLHATPGSTLTGRRGY